MVVTDETAHAHTQPHAIVTGVTSGKYSQGEVCKIVSAMLSLLTAYSNYVISSNRFCQKACAVNPSCQRAHRRAIKALLFSLRLLF